MNQFNKILALILLCAYSSVFAQKVKDCPKVKEIDASIEAVSINFDDNHRRTTLAYLESLHYYHFKKMVLNDSFSEKLLDKYIDFLDGRKIYFLQSDIDSFKNKYQFSLDNLLILKNLTPLKEIYELYRERAINRLTHSISLLENPKQQFKYEADVVIPIDSDLYQRSANYADNLSLWKKLTALELVNLMLNDDSEGRS